MARRKTEIKAGDGGTLSVDLAEMLAQGMADGLTPPEAWKAIGRENRAWYLTQRQEYEANPAFQKRVADLKAERTRLMQDPVLGEATWMVNQLFRHAAVARDLKVMSEAAAYRLKIMQAQISAMPEAVAEPSDAPPKRPVGKPPTENPQARGSTAASVRDKLMRVGVEMAEAE